MIVQGVLLDWKQRQAIQKREESEQKRKSQESTNVGETADSVTGQEQNRSSSRPRSSSSATQAANLIQTSRSSEHMLKMFHEMFPKNESSNCEATKSTLSYDTEAGEERRRVPQQPSSLSGSVASPRHRQLTAIKAPPRSETASPTPLGLSIRLHTPNTYGNSNPSPRLDPLEGHIDAVKRHE